MEADSNQRHRPVVDWTVSLSETAPMSTITAAVSRGQEAPFTIETLTMSEPGPDEVLVKIHAAGLCHTDLATLAGPMMAWPAVLGHEGAGVIEAVGSNVTGFQVGDHVATYFAWCGRCAACLQGQPTRCDQMWPLNFGGRREDGTTPLSAADGSPVGARYLGQSCFATHAMVSSRSVIKVPQEIDLTVIAALGCGTLTGAGAVLNTLKVGAADHLVVSGVGAVGLGAVMAASAAGATRIVAIDIVQERLDLALAVGATHAIDGRSDDVLGQIRQAIPGGVDYAFDASGAPEAVMTSLAALKLNGKIALAAGGLAAAAQSPVLTGKTVYNTLVGEAVPAVLLPRLIELHLHGKFPIERVVSTYPLEQIDAAVADTQAGKVLKAVFTP